MDWFLRVLRILSAIVPFIPGVAEGLGTSPESAAVIGLIGATVIKDAKLITNKITGREI